MNGNYEGMTHWNPIFLKLEREKGLVNREARVCEFTKKNTSNILQFESSELKHKLFKLGVKLERAEYNVCS